MLVIFEEKVLKKSSFKYKLTLFILLFQWDIFERVKRKKGLKKFSHIPKIKSKIIILSIKRKCNYEIE